MKRLIGRIVTGLVFLGVGYGMYAGTLGPSLLRGMAADPEAAREYATDSIGACLTDEMRAAVWDDVGVRELATKAFLTMYGPGVAGLSRKVAEEMADAVIDKGGRELNPQQVKKFNRLGVDLFGYPPTAICARIELGVAMGLFNRRQGAEEIGTSGEMVGRLMKLNKPDRVRAVIEGSIGECLHASAREAWKNRKVQEIFGELVAVATQVSVQRRVTPQEMYKIENFSLRRIRGMTHDEQMQVHAVKASFDAPQTGRCFIERIQLDLS